MGEAPIIRGTLRDGGAIELLRELEQKRITGRLCFESSAVAGEVTLFGGEIAAAQASREDGRDPVDLLLELAPGHAYAVHPQLPPLPVSAGDDMVKSGSLAVHVPADLMRYCEHAGLTGILELRNGPRRAEAVYEAGELRAIELDGREDPDLSEVFAWEQGRFRISLDLEAPERVSLEPPPAPEPSARRARQDTGQFLRVVEMALVEVIGTSERARSPARSSPPLPEPPKARPRPSSMPRPPQRRDDEQTVRLIYRSGEPAPGPAHDGSARHARRGHDAQMALTEAEPARRAPSSPPEPSAMTKNDEKLGADERPTDDEAASASDEPSVPDAADASAALDSDAALERADEPEPGPVDAPPEPPRAPPAVAGKPLEAIAWAIGFLALALLILAILARFEPVQ